MKLVTYRHGRTSRPGALLASGDILDLRKALPEQDDEPLWSVAQLLARGPEALRDAAALVKEVDADPSSASERGWIVSGQSAQLLNPLGQPTMLWTVGMMYPEHAEEMNVPFPENLNHALRSANAIVGPGEPVVLPRMAPDMVDWEGELALVIGAPTYRVSPDEAMDYVAGYTIYNDIGARDHCQPFIDEIRSGGLSAGMSGLNLLYKEFPTFSPVGPCVATADEIDLDSAVLRTTLNGETVQEFKPGHTGRPIADAVSYMSQVCHMMPGDILSLGTAEGVGFAKKPPRYMRPGDEITITVDGIGSLSNPVVADT
ncbi:fumarylacetoacetate hydrolase family protein [Henriciella aquimarina]|uniref:fumarylacetoacetate hydrolase family protein n=1 Tax=Henriciella aquimarina TaxID=545261 RepID=UPI000A058E6B|nr:fumarylacetoacetate hydrolase family protein [Henriciella aquimarina]